MLERRTVTPAGTPDRENTRMRDTAVLQVSGLSKRYGDLQAVENVTFSLTAGGAIGLVGESGSGKSTIAGLLVGLTTPSAGTIQVGGRTLPARAHGRHERLKRAKQIQMVFQDPLQSLDPRATAADSIGQALRLHRSMTRAERDREAAHLLDQVGLSSREGRALPRTLSGGQCQRVAIARALAVQPQILILDEATSALDVSSQAQILALLRELRRETDVSFLLVSHDLAVVRAATDEVLVLYEGKIVERGLVEQTLLTPQHPYTALLLASVPGPDWDPNCTSELRSRFLADESQY